MRLTPRRTHIAIAAALALSVACGGSSDTAPTQTSATPAPSGPGVSVSTPELQTPSSTGPARVSASVSGACRLADSGSEITVSYRVLTEGSARVSRIRFLVDGRLSEETGPTSERDFRRNATVKVPDGTTHIFEVIAEAGSNLRATAITTVRCVTPTRGPTL